MRNRRLPLCLALVLATTPMAAMAQESPPDGEKPEPQPAVQLAANLPTAAETGTIAASLRQSSKYAALVATPVVSVPGEDVQPVPEDAPVVPAAPSEGSGAGLGFMIGGAAAFVGGLIIGGTGGTLIAAGGVGLGVYGAIIYF